MKRSIFVSFFIIAVSLSVWAINIQQSDTLSKCSLDGSRIEPLYEVIIIQKDNSTPKFSCIVSAQIWFRGNSERVYSILVTDEVTEEKIKADHAFYVESDVITSSHTGNNIHVFAQKAAAKSHALKFNGKFVKNPFRAPKKNSPKMVKYRPVPKDGSDFLFPSPQRYLYLPSTAVLVRQQNCSWISQRYNGRLLDGYSSPPFKPPKDLV